MSESDLDISKWGTNDDGTAPGRPTDGVKLRSYLRGEVLVTSSNWYGPGGVGINFEVEASVRPAIIGPSPTYHDIDDFTALTAVTLFVFVRAIAVETVCQPTRSDRRQGDEVTPVESRRTHRWLSTANVRHAAVLVVARRSGQPSGPIEHVGSRGGYPGDQSGEEPAIHPTARKRDSDLGVCTRVGEGDRVTESRSDDNRYIVRSGSTKHTTVGKFCSIAAFVRLEPSNHPLKRARQHHMTNRRRHGLDDNDESVFERRSDQPVQVGYDAWLGHAATVMPDVAVAAGAVVAAGGVVTDDVEPYTPVGGVPAEQIGRRPTPEVATELQVMAWRDWSRDVPGDAFEGLSGDAREFAAEYGSGPVSQPGEPDR